jgi:hypothetical protein
MKKNQRYTLQVSFGVEETISFEAVKYFIEDALETWGGQRHPDDPLFGSLKNVSVKKIPSPAKQSK